MNIQKYIPSQYLLFIKQQKYLLLLGGVTCIFLISIVVLSVSSQQKQKQAGMTQTQQPTSVVRQETAGQAATETTEENGFFDIFSFFSKPQSTSQQSSTESTAQSGSQGTATSETSQTNTDSSGQTSIQSGTRSSWNNAPVTGNGSGTSSSTSQGSTQSSGSTGTSSQSTGTSSTKTPTVPTNTPAPADIQIVFENPDGSTTEYKPPGTPPTEVKWGRYVSYQDHYAIDYPVNWQIDVSVVNGHEGVTLYAPGANRNNPETPYIGFGWSQSYLVAASGSLENAFDTPLLVSNVSGTLYTDGPLGTSYIASIFPYTSGYFGLGASNSDVTFSYVYYYMLHSLEFGVY